MTIRAYTIHEFRQISNEYDVPLHVIIQDYAATAVLLEIARNPVISDFVVFKGGTAIRRVYFPEARFSIDLDFEALKYFSLDELGEISYKELKKLEDKSIGSVLITEVEKPIITKQWVQINIFYEAPGLKYLTRFDIELRKRDSKYVKRKIRTKPFAAMREEEIQALTLEELLAEKLLAIFERTNPRDLWDAFFLIKIKGVHLRDIGKLIGVPLKEYIKSLELFSEWDWQTLTVQYLPKSFKKYTFEEVISFMTNYVITNWKIY